MMCVVIEVDTEGAVTLEAINVTNSYLHHRPNIEVALPKLRYSLFGVHFVAADVAVPISAAQMSHSSMHHCTSVG